MSLTLEQLRHTYVIFQFQYGTIMRRMQYSYNDSLAAFQFQYGTIMRLFCLVHFVYSLYFNSSMVRLWGAIDLTYTCLYPFQFQYGTIMRNPLKIDVFWLVISIPVWYDYEHERDNSIQMWFLISIPVWYDYENQTHKHNLLFVLYFNSSMVRLWVAISEF